MSLSTFPTVSVVLPVRNEASNIQRCINELVRQDYPRNRLEIIIADGNSEDSTAELAETVAKTDSRLRVLRLSQRGRSQGLNQAILQSTGNVVLRMDARTSVASDYVRRMVETLVQTGADNVGPAQRPISKSRKQKAIGLALCHPFGVGDSQYRLGRRSGYAEHVYLGCFWRAIFDRVGYFDEESAVIAEDADFSQRIWQAGGKVYLNSDVSAYYYPRESYSAFWRLYFRYGGARAGTLLKHQRLTSWRQTVPPAFILALLLAIIVGFWYTVSYYALFFLLGSYGAVSAGVSLFVARNNADFRLMPLVFIAFNCMHFAWGCGFLRRILIPERTGRFWLG